MSKTRIPLPLNTQLSTKSVEMVAELELNLRIVNALESIGVLTVHELLHRTPAELLRIQNFGQKSLDEVLVVLEGHGYKKSA